MDRSRFYICRVTIDGMPSTGIPCILEYDKYWNGWECPYFEKDAIEKIRQTLFAIAGVNEDNLYDENGYLRAEVVEYDEGKDMVACYMQGMPMFEHEWVEYWEGFDMDFGCGDIRHVYMIGAGSWIWSKL